MKKVTMSIVLARVFVLGIAIASIASCGGSGGTPQSPLETTATDNNKDVGASIIGDFGNTGGTDALFAGSLVAPLKIPMVVTRGYGAWAKFNGVWERHLGVDIDATTGDALYAPVSGKIAALLYIAGYGSNGIVSGESKMRSGWVILIQASGSTTPYVVMLGHVSPDTSLHVGDNVTTGQKLGTIARYDAVDSKGSIFADWAHLHIGVRNGTYPDGGIYYAGYNKYGEDIVEYGGKWTNPLSFTSPPNSPVVQTISISEPVANSTLIQGTPYNISWSSSNVIVNVRVHLYRNGAFYQTLSASSPKNGSIPFTPLTTMPIGDGYSIGISSLDNKAFDFTNGFFSIAAAPTPEVVPPVVTPPVVTPPVVTPEMNSANYVTIYRFNNSVGARCYGNSTSVPTACSGYSYEREAFIIGKIALPGTFPLAHCSNGTDHILVDVNSSDYSKLTNCELLGYTFNSNSIPTSYPFSHVCGVARYAFNTTGGGSHLFTIGADSLTNMTLELPNPRFLALSNSATCSNVLR